MIARRKTSFLADGTYRFEDQLEVKGVVTATVVTCTGWLLELYYLRRGELSFLSGENKIRPKGKRFGVFYPPFTIARACFNNVASSLLGLARTEPLPFGTGAVPFLFETTLPSEGRSVATVLEEGHDRQSIDANPKASSLSMKAKTLIVAARSSDPSIAAIAKRLGVSNEHLSRQFRRDYGMSPREYLHQLRIADAPLRLAKGEAIADVSQEAGYGDLSRFYKQFHKATQSSPGRCREMMRPRGG
jgi:AraC-like DNA-binding protein